MHARELVELGALIAAHGPAFLEANEQLSERGIQQYWSASKCRLDRWSRSLKSYSHHLQTVLPRAAAEHWQEVRPVLEEILTSELLTRIWTCLLCQHDQLRGEDQFGPIGQNVLAGHLEARNRALNLMVYGRGFSVEEAVAMNRLRRRTERWTDVLLGRLIDHCDIGPFVFDLRRAQDFSNDLRRGQNTAAGCMAWKLVLASLRAAYQKGLAPGSPNADLNEIIGAGVLSCLGSELFDSLGIVKSLWVVRLYQTTRDTQGMIEELLREEGAPATDVTPTNHRYDLPNPDGPSARF